MRFEPKTLENIDNWRARQPDLPSRAEAIRRLIETGLSTNERKPITLTDGEQLIMHLLCDLQKHLKAPSDLEPDFVQAALHGGHHWGLEWRYPGIYHHHKDKPAAVREVANILDMWRIIEASYNDLTPSDKKRIAQEAQPFGKNVAFRGFDGNNEDEHFSIARFMINDLERFEEFNGRDLNSHTPMLKRYRRMLHAFEPMLDILTGGFLDATNLITLLNAMRHNERTNDPKVVKNRPGHE